MPNVQELPAHKLPTLSFWQSRYGKKADALLAGISPGTMVDITGKVNDSDDPWPIVPEIPCGHDEDCVAPSETIFHLVKPLSNWPFERISVRSRGEIAADFLTSEDGAVERRYVVLSGPDFAIIEGILNRGEGKETGALAFRVELKIPEPTNFEKAIIATLGRAAKLVNDTRP